jgi:hypothetical protein
MGLSPDPQYPERGNYVYDAEGAPNQPGQRGPLRFEEGLATDTDLPDSFRQGMLEPMIPSPGRLNHVNPAIQYKFPEETMRQRAHVGSAAWIDAPSMLGEFAHGSFTDVAEVTYEQVTRSGGRQQRRAPTMVTD